MGKTNPFTVLVVLAVLLGGWWLFTFGPLYLDHLEVREAAAETLALLPMATDPKNAMVVPLARLNSKVGYHYQVDEETGVESVLPGLGLTTDNFSVDVDAVEKRSEVRISYDRVVQLKPLQRRQRVHFVAESKRKLQ